jgi:hypothetical protein
MSKKSWDKEVMREKKRLSKQRQDSDEIHSHNRSREEADKALEARREQGDKRDREVAREGGEHSQPRAEEERRAARV